MSGKKIFVTVGTTKFDKLIKTVTTPEILKVLNDRGYDRLTLQIGQGTLEPDCTRRCGFRRIESFRLSPSIREHVQSADLIVSHAGAGSCLEALEAQKPLVVVKNELLMEDHQSQLAEQLRKDGHLYSCTCDGLLDLLRTMDLDKLKPFDTNDSSQRVASFIDRMMGF